MLKGLRCIVRDYVSENPNANYNMIANRFGTPQQLAESCILEMEPSEVLKQVHIHKKVFLVVVIAVAVLTITRFGLRLAAYLQFCNEMNGYAVVEIIEYERTELDGGNRN